jgi:hypothetical protein
VARLALARFTSPTAPSHFAIRRICAAAFPNRRPVIRARSIHCCKNHQQLFRAGATPAARCGLKGPGSLLPRERGESRPVQRPAPDVCTGRQARGRSSQDFASVSGPLLAGACCGISKRPSSALWKYWLAISIPLNGRIGGIQLSSRNGTVVTKCTHRAGS